MATASSAQREPSMEEILASIRRIIEDSDTGRKQADDADELRQDLAPAVGPASDVEAFRNELQAETRKPVTLAEVQAQLTEPVVARLEPAPVKLNTPAPANPAAAVAAPSISPAPMTLAEVSARIASEPAPTARAEAPVRAKAETTDSIVTDWRREIAAVGNQAKPADVAKAQEVRQQEAEKRQVIAEVEAFEDDLAAEPAFEPRPSSSEQARHVDATPARPAIVSEHTGRQVAAAFGELSDAFASRSKKTFDEMAEEMLRPMLQDWLDNNLPTLVERLVREEIERVARGAQ